MAFVVVVTVLPRRRGADDEEEKKAQARRDFKKLDWMAAGRCPVAVTMVMLGLSVGPSFGWTSPWTLGMFAFGVAMTWLFIYRLHHADNRSSQRTTSSAATLLCR